MIFMKTTLQQNKSFEELKVLKRGQKVTNCKILRWVMAAKAFLLFDAIKF